MSAGRVPADPPAKNIRCDAKDHARPRKYLEQNTFPNRGVQVEYYCAQMVGQAWLNPSLRRLGAEFKWGMAGPEELSLGEPRWRVINTYPVMERLGSVGIQRELMTAAAM